MQSPSCAHSLLRSFIRLHGVNHNQPFPTATSLHKTSTSSFTIFIVFQCFRRRRVSKALIYCGLHRNMPKACPYVMTQFVCPSIVADINHRKPKQTKRTVPLVCFGLFALSDNLISEVWFFAEGERFLSFWRCHRPRKRAALGVWCDWFKLQLEIRHTATLTTGAKHWHRQKAVFYVFVSVPPVFIH